jgi:glycosyltransferase involved in cell wall biosynthesis
VVTKFLFLYTELAPYFLACVDRLVQDHDAEVHIVRWPVNAEAPFNLRFAERVQVYDRADHTDDALLGLVNTIDPDIAFASGWVDKGYLRCCRALRRKGKPTVICSDTAWRGDLRQLAATIAARLWLKRTFTHAWVTGATQYRYARKLGFDGTRISTGFYSADVDRFSSLAEQFSASKKNRFPHRFLCVARYIPTKGHQLLCDAFAELCDTGSTGDWELWIAGAGELQEQVMRSASGRHPSIKHLGFVQADAMPTVMAQCGVFVLPSTYEPWGVVVHEHACAGFPLLLSSAVGARERFLQEGKNGLVFDAGSKEALKTAMVGIMKRSDAELINMATRSAGLGAAWHPGAWSRTAIDIIARA